jgi:hypothetical protein
MNTQPIVRSTLRPIILSPNVLIRSLCKSHCSLCLEKSVAAPVEENLRSPCIHNSKCLIYNQTIKLAESQFYLYQTVNRNHELYSGVTSIDMAS